MVQQRMVHNRFRARMSTTREELTPILAPVRHVLLDFDGPVCSVFASIPASDIARDLRGELWGEKTPDWAKSESDPLALLHRIDEERPDLVPQADDLLMRLEEKAAVGARPTPGSVAFLKACAAGGRSVWLVSNNARSAMTGYLAAHGLDRYVADQFGRIAGKPSSMKPSPQLLYAAMRAAGADARECVFVGDAVRDVQAADAAGMVAIGYANKPGKAERMVNAGAAAIVTSMSDLAAAIPR